MKRKDVLTVGPFGIQRSNKDALERNLQQRMWLAEHSKGDIQRKALEDCQQLVRWLEVEEKRVRL